MCVSLCMSDKSQTAKRRQNFKNELYFDSMASLDKNNNQCIVFHNEKTHIKSDLVLQLGDMR